MYRRPESNMCFFLFSFVYLETSLFPSICAISAFSLYVEYVVRSFLPNDVFLPFDHGLDFLHQLIIIIIIIIERTLTRPLEPVSQECKEHTIHIPKRKPWLAESQKK